MSPIYTFMARDDTLYQVLLTKEQIDFIIDTLRDDREYAISQDVVLSEEEKVVANQVIYKYYEKMIDKLEHAKSTVEKHTVDNVIYLQR